MKPVVGVVMGSDSDWKVVKDATKVLKEFLIPFEAKVVSAHRTPELMAEYGKNASSKGLNVIIAAAGGAAHLPGMLASYTTLPVIGIPIQSKGLQGLDSLLSIVQMPKGIPVACVAINGAKNAALLAIRMLATKDAGLLKRLKAFQKKQQQESLKKKLS